MENVFISSGLDEAINSRPPMPFDLDNPGPCRYTPRNKPLNETNAPEFTFGHRLQEKGELKFTHQCKNFVSRLSD